MDMAQEGGSKMGLEQDVKKIKVNSRLLPNGIYEQIPAELTDKLQYNLLAPLGLANLGITEIYNSNKAQEKVLERRGY